MTVMRTVLLRRAAMPGRRSMRTGVTPGSLSRVECRPNYKVIARGAMTDLTHAYSIEDLRRIAKRRLPQAIFDFFDGGAEDEVTLRENRAAFERVRLLPKVLVDVAEVDTRVPLFGQTSALPL